MTSDTYPMADKPFEQERHRLSVQAAMLDPQTFHFLEGRGIDAGWRCLEMGAGTGSVARWLAGRVGRTGSVVAADIDLRYLELSDLPNVEVRRVDVRADALEVAAYDLVHARLFLVSLRNAEEIVGKLAASVRPGGWLVLEETATDLMFCPPQNEFAALHARIWRALMECVRPIGGDPHIASYLASYMANVGLQDIDSMAWAPLVLGNTERAKIVCGSTVDELSQWILGTGTVTQADLDRYHELLADPRTVGYHVAVAAAWGRRP